MGFFNNLFTAGDRGRNRGSEDVASANVVKRIGNYFGFFGGSADSPAVTPEQAMEISAVFSAVKLITQRVSATPFSLWEVETKNTRHFKREVRNHWAYNLVNVRPNPYQTPAEFMETVMISALMTSGALIYKAKDTQGKVIELWPIPTGSWTHEVLADGSEQFRVTLVNGKQTVYSSKDIIFIHGPGFDGYSGISAIASARQVLGISNSLTRAQKGFADNGGEARGIINTQHEIAEEQREAMMAEIKRKFAPGQSGLMLLHGDTKFTSLSDNFNNSQFMQQREFVTKEIANIFNIPHPFLLGGTRTELDNIALNQDAIRPWLIRIEQALNSYLLNNDPKFKFDADEYTATRSDPLLQVTVLQKALGAGGTPAIMSQNEARAIIGLNPIDDELYDVVSLGGYATASNLNDENLRNDTEITIEKE